MGGEADLEALESLPEITVLGLRSGGAGAEAEGGGSPTKRSSFAITESRVLKEVLLSFPQTLRILQTARFGPDICNPGSGLVFILPGLLRARTQSP